MTHPRLPPAPRGAALVLALILLGALSVIGIAAVSLASRERTNAYAYSRADYAVACANAAQAKMWAEMTQYGVAYIGSASPVTSFTLPDGTVITAPAHYDSKQADGTLPPVKDVIFTVESAASGGASTEADATNKIVMLQGASKVTVGFAHCRFRTAGVDVEMEIELGYRFAL